MKLFVVALFALVAVTAAADEVYTSKFDNVNVDDILKSDRLFTNYFKCLMDTGRCTPEGSELKRLLPDALKTSCKKCTEKQQVNTDKVLRFISSKKPKQWEELKAKFDPDNVYVVQYREAAAARGIEI